MVDEMDNINELTALIEDWMLGRERDYLVGGEVSRNMARAALSVLDAVRDTSQFVEEEVSE